jgi:integrase
MYLVLRHSTWWALHDIPRSLRAVLGKPRFAHSLKTSNKEDARRRAALLEVRWRGEISRARRNAPDDPMDADALYWRKMLTTAKDEAERASILDMATDAASMRAVAYAHSKGALNADPETNSRAIEESGYYKFVDIVEGKVVFLDDHLDDFLATLVGEAKSKDQKRASILRFKARFPHVQSINQRGLQQYVNDAATAGAAPATIRRQLSELRTYWRYLASLEIVPRYPPPFDGLTIPQRSGKQQALTTRRAFEPSEVVYLQSEASSRGDQQLADLIELAMYTGARIEELCALPLAKVSDKTFEIEDAKSEAGRRTVPVHPKLLPLAKRLRKISKDGFLLSGLGAANQYLDRSPALSKRFGRLKRSLGFPDVQVFHSIRKTVSTMLEQAGVAENVAADTLGHDKPTITYGLYASGTSLEQRRKAIAKLKYPTLAQVLKARAQAMALPVKASP